MDRQIAERAIQALAALKSSPRGAHTGTQPSALTEEVQNEETGGLCGSPYCGGCYDVGDGRKIHPPKCGESFLRWRAWLEGKGPRQ